MHVIHVVPALFGRNGVFGGAERYTFELARRMARVAATSLLSFGEKPDAFTTDEGLGVRVLGPAWKVRGQALNPSHLRLFTHLRSTDIIHCHQPHTLASELAALSVRLRGARVFASELGKGGWGFSSYLRTDNCFPGHLNISEYSQELAGHAGRPDAQVIYGAVDTESFSPDPATQREPLVVDAGRLMPHKGINDLVEALLDGLTLELIGQPYHAQFQVGLQRLAVGKRILFRADCDDRAVAA